MNDILDELVRSAEPWTAYRTLRDLRGLPESDPEVATARMAMLSHPLVKGVVDALKDWPGDVLNSHKSSSQSFHKLAFLADIGVTKADPGMPEIIDKILALRGEDGIVRLQMKLTHGAIGSDETKSGWALCDAPVTLRALSAMGCGNDSAVADAAHALNAIGRLNGWPCRLSPEAGAWRGPGRKEDPCPYATLIMLKLAAEYADLREGAEARAGVEALLELWRKSREIHPYIFYMGTDFRKLKVPEVWYDIVHVADVLSHFPTTHDDPRFADMMSVIEAKPRIGGMNVPESDWKAWTDAGFSKKGTPSPWLTFVIRRIQARIGKRSG